MLLDIAARGFARRTVRWQKRQIGDPIGAAVHRLPSRAPRSRSVRRHAPLPGVPVGHDGIDQRHAGPR